MTDDDDWKIVTIEVRHRPDGKWIATAFTHDGEGVQSRPFDTWGEAEAESQRVRDLLKTIRDKHRQ